MRTSRGKGIFFALLLLLPITLIIPLLLVSNHQDFIGNQYVFPITRNVLTKSRQYLNEKTVRTTIKLRVAGCKNTGQGKVLICDSNGMVCHRRDVNQGQCCRFDPGVRFDSDIVNYSLFELKDKKMFKNNTTETENYLINHQYQCNGCSKNDACCEEYEYCVSCCMDPRNLVDHQDISRLEVLMKHSFENIEHYLQDGLSDFPFAYCSVGIGYINLRSIITFIYTYIIFHIL